MEFIMIAIIAIVVMLLLGVSVFKIMMGVLWVLDGLAFLSFLFFLIAAVMSLFTKKMQARYLRLEKNGRYGEHAVYEVEGEECSNLFPTDHFLKDLLYRSEDVKVQVGKFGKHRFVLDKLSLVIIGIGLPVFLLMAVGILMLTVSFL